MLLGYPLDFKDATTLVEVCTPFARVLHWNSEDNSMSRVLLKVLVEDRREIPRDVVIKMGRESDGRAALGQFPFTSSTLRFCQTAHPMKRTPLTTMVIRILSMAQF
jgi:hypothetical protein